MGVQRMLIYRPSTNQLGEEKARGQLTEVRNGYRASWYPAFLNAHRLWPVVLFHLEAVGKTRLGKHDSIAGVSVLWVWSTIQVPYGQWHSLLKQGG